MSKYLLCFDDLRTAARRSLPRPLFDYLDGASNDGLTFDNNRRDLEAIRLAARVLKLSRPVDLRAGLLGEDYTMPVMLAPVGLAGSFHCRGEALAAEAAGALGIPQCLSSFSVVPMEQVRAAAASSLLYQVYVLQDRAISEDMLARAKACGIDTIVLTVDTPITATRRLDIRNGLRVATRPSAKMIASAISRPRWLAQTCRNGMPSIANMARYEGLAGNLFQQTPALGRAIKMDLSWEDVDWFRANWSGKLVLKGIQSAQDAVLAVRHGVDAITVSNHGGRQLDSAASTISLLPGIRAAIGSDVPVIFDSGVRSGMDVVKALALGADFVSVGRAWAFGLSAAGRPGIEQAIRIIERQMVETMHLMGCQDIVELKQLGKAALAKAPGHTSGYCA